MQESEELSKQPAKVNKWARDKKIKALAAAGLTQREIAKQVELSVGRVNAIITEAFTPQEMAQFKDIEANLIAKKRADIIKSIGEQDIEKASLMQKAASYGILYDKQALLEGRATSIMDVDIRHLIASISAPDQSKITVDNPVDNFSSSNIK